MHEERRLTTAFHAVFILLPISGTYLDFAQNFFLINNPPTMRLLNLDTFEVETGLANERQTNARAALWRPTRSGAAALPPYAILSHRWGQNEAEFSNLRHTERVALSIPV